MLATKDRELYVCPLCGYVDHDCQDGTGHWEHGTCSDEHLEAGGWSYWALMCNGCGQVNDMRVATDEDVRNHAELQAAKKVSVERVPSSNQHGVITAYAVRIGRSHVGFVWSCRRFSYRGTKGWNRGLRCRDFHPITWHYGGVSGTRFSKSLGRNKRWQAIRELIETVASVASESGEK